MGRGREEGGTEERERPGQQVDRAREGQLATDASMAHGRQRWMGGPGVTGGDDGWWKRDRQGMLAVIANRPAGGDGGVHAQGVTERYHS